MLELLAGSQLLGLVFARYVLKVPTIAGLSVRELARTVGPTIDWYVFGDIELETDGLTAVDHERVTNGEATEVGAQP